MRRGDVALADRAKALRKIGTVFDQRKLVNAHLFTNETGWHIFYGSQKDMMGEHGRIGPHLHYVSHLCLPDAVCGLLWQELDKRAYKMGNDFHIRYVDQDLEKYLDDDGAG